MNRVWKMIFARSLPLPETIFNPLQNGIPAPQSSTEGGELARSLAFSLSFSPQEKSRDRWSSDRTRTEREREEEEVLSSLGRCSLKPEIEFARKSDENCEGGSFNRLLQTLSPQSWKRDFRFNEKGAIIVHAAHEREQGEATHSSRRS